MMLDLTDVAAADILLSPYRFSVSFSEPETGMSELLLDRAGRRRCRDSTSVEHHATKGLNSPGRSAHG
jgi:hypothetical protein